MNKELILQTLEKVKADAPPRKFTQRVEVIINLQGINVKKTEDQVKLYVDLPHETGRTVKICGLVDKQLAAQAKKEFDAQLEPSEFETVDKKKLKKLASSHDYFVAQATIMPKVGRFLGPVLGKKGKLPDPKAGCIVPPNADLGAVKKRLSKIVKANAKVEPVIKCGVGTEKMDPGHVAENILAVYNRVKGALPQEEHNIKNVMLKLTMSPAVKVEGKKK